MTVSQTLFWGAILVLGALDIAKAASFIVYLNGSMANKFETPLDKPLDLLPYLNKEIKTVIFAGGFQNSVDGPAITTMISTYLSRGNTNVLLLNWDKESQGGNIGLLGYGVAIAAAKVVAVNAGKGLVTLFENGIDPALVFLIGHSLGAHLMGWVGERVQKNNYNISRICGLDPAGPAFGQVLGIEALNPSQARFVFTVITNPGFYGTPYSLGTVNFRVNCNYGARQPGCRQGNFLPLSKDDSCSHNRPWMIYSESVLNPGSFPAARADSCNDWKSQNSPNIVINYLGDDVDSSKPGDYYLSTNYEAPYSRGDAGLRPN